MRTGVSHTESTTEAHIVAAGLGSGEDYGYVNIAGLGAWVQEWKQRGVLTFDLPAQGKRRAVGGCRG